MLEGKPIHPSDSRNSAADTQSDERLCELDWANLVARLCAARELRAELAAHHEMALASFDAESARHLASQIGGYRNGEDERDVNPDDLANGKGRAAEGEAHAHRDTPATRGNT